MNPYYGWYDFDYYSFFYCMRVWTYHYHWYHNARVSFIGKRLQGMCTLVASTHAFIFHPFISLHLHLLFPSLFASIHNNNINTNNCAARTCELHHTIPFHIIPSHYHSMGSCNDTILLFHFSKQDALSFIL